VESAEDIIRKSSQATFILSTDSKEIIQVGQKEDRLMFEDGTGQLSHTMKMIMIALLSVNLIFWHIDSLLGINL
jgi:hypothetical protein